MRYPKIDAKFVALRFAGLRLKACPQYYRIHVLFYFMYLHSHYSFEAGYHFPNVSALVKGI